MNLLSLKLKPCPEPGDGVHFWVCYAACTLVRAGVSDEEAEPMIEELMTRDPKRNEIKDALCYARGERRNSSLRWSPPNAEKIAEIEKEGPTLLELVSLSPWPIQFGEESRSDEIIDALFPGNPLLCVGKSDASFYTAERRFWRGRLRGQSLIVPSPMSAKVGRTQQGKLSPHCLENTGPRRFLIIEFDRGTLDQQAALLWHLRQFGPLAAVVFSGNKSVHSWFFCAGLLEDKLRRFFNYAHSLGADRATWTRSQFVRMPDGTRHDGKSSTALTECGIVGVPAAKQIALFFNPEVTSYE